MTLGGISLNDTNKSYIETNSLDGTELQALFDTENPIQVSAYPNLSISWRMEEITGRKNDQPLLGSEIGFYIQKSDASAGAWVILLTSDLKGEPTLHPGTVIYTAKPYVKNFYFDEVEDLETRTQLNKYNEDPNSPYYNPIRSDLYKGQFSNKSINLQYYTETLLGTSVAILGGFYMKKHDPDAELTLGGIDVFNSSSNSRTVFETAKKKTIINSDPTPYSFTSGHTLEEARDLAIQYAQEKATDNEAYSWVEEERQLDFWHKSRRYLVESYALFSYEDEEGKIEYEMAKATYVVPLSRTDMLAPLSFNNIIEEEIIAPSEPEQVVYLYHDPIK